MRMYFLLPVLFALAIGTGLAVNADIGDVGAFKQALEKDGFTVQEGGLGFFDFIKIYDMGIAPSAYGNNPATKYLVYLVPPASGHEITGKISEIVKVLGVTAKVTPFFSLRPDEAVVFIGRTPPECRYFSFDHNLMERTYGNETRWIYANLADTINNLNINTEGKGHPMDCPEILITKPR
jgi:hypothetical protein